MRDGVPNGAETLAPQRACQRDNDWVRLGTFPESPVVKHDDADVRAPRQRLDRSGDCGGIEVGTNAVPAVSEQPAVADADRLTSRRALDEVGWPGRDR